MLADMPGLMPIDVGTFFATGKTAWLRWSKALAMALWLLWRDFGAATDGSRCFVQWKGRAARIAIDSGRHVNYIYLSAHLIENKALLSHSTRSHQRRI
jgi:hypothetical protein